MSTVVDSRSAADTQPRMERVDVQVHGRRPTAPLQRLTWAAAGVVVLAVGYVPAGRVPVIADDFQALQEVHAVSNGSLWEAVVFGIQQGRAGGHFNPLGQVIGSAYHFAAYDVSAALGISPQYFDVFAYIALILLTVAGATYAAVWGLSRTRGGRPAYWPLFALICAITAATLQIHAFWSNDPVVSYGPAGWGSAALGFWTIAWALRAVAPDAAGKRAIVVCSLLALGCVLYYEMLVAAVAAVAVVAVLTATLAADRMAVRKRCLLVVGTGVLLPAVVFVAGRRLGLPSDTVSGYTGTTISFGTDALETWWYGMVGALPGGGWNFIAEVAGAPVLRGPSLLLAGALCVLLGVIGFGWARQSAREPLEAGTDRSASTRSALILVAALVTFWVAATAAHSVTLKSIEEIRHPGQVYLFYAVGVVVVAVLIALLLTVLVRRARTAALVALTPLVGLFVLVQVALNMAVADAVHRNYPQNAPLVALSTDGNASADVRCAVLAAWVAEPWPEYYIESVVENLQENYELEFGRPFCDQPFGRTP